MDNIQIETTNNKQIVTYYSEANDQSKKIVIMSHGFRGSSLGPARQFVDFQKILNKNGYSVLRFDQPNSGNSDGDYVDSSFLEWVQTTVFLADKYINSGYQVALLGQSMGATTSVIAASSPKLKGKIVCLLLWVPDAKSDVDVDPSRIYEEGGQKYKGSFWTEARDSNFFDCLESYNGGIHLVYGEVDRYVKKALIDKTIRIVEEKGHPVMVLKGQDHSPWEFDVVQKVYKNGLEVLHKFMK